MKKAQRKKNLVKNLKKFYGLVIHDDETAIQELVDIIPWLKVQGQLPTKNEMIEQIRQLIKEVQSDYIVERFNDVEGIEGQKTLFKKTKKRLVEAGIDLNTL